LKNLVSRTITGALLVALLIAGITINQFTFLVIFGAIIVAGLFEFYKIFSKNNVSPQVWPGVILGVVIFIGNFALASGYIYAKLFLSIVPIVMYIVIAELFRKHDNPFANIAITLLGAIYVALPLSLFWHLAFRDNIEIYNPHLILGFFIIMWCYDTFAYLAGMAFGKHRLFERISPKKSWEGAIGGYIFSLVFAWLLSLIYTDLNLTQWFVFATIIAIFGTFGDLVESMMKRSVDIKDSSNVLPGHGGILDRFDAVLLAVPAIFIYLQLI
jgi:phosphatidate cytidylyltransferase